MRKKQNVSFDGRLFHYGASVTETSAFHVYDGSDGETDSVQK